MGATSRTKGKRGELEVVQCFKDHGVEAHRTAPMQAGTNGYGDVAISVPGFHVESKCAGRLSIAEWQRQAALDAPPGIVPVVAWRLSRRGAWTPWHASLPLDDFAVMVRRAAA